MDAYGQTRDVGYQHQPAIRVFRIRFAVPLQYRPEDHRRYQRRRGVHLSLDRREPERVGKGIGERARETATHHRQRPHSLGILGGSLSVGQSADKPRYAPEQEQNGECTAERRKDVRHQRCVLRGGEHREQMSEHREQRRSGRMTHFEFVGGCDELAAIPQTRRRFNGRYVSERGYRESHPSDDIVYVFVFHSLYIFYTFLNSFAAFVPFS